MNTDNFRTTLPQHVSTMHLQLQPFILADMYCEHKMAIFCSKRKTWDICQAVNIYSAGIETLKFT
jgi:hypothetical protein